ncbi:MAG: ATP-binding protein [Fibrobacterota bacterium]
MVLHSFLTDNFYYLISVVTALYSFAFIYYLSSRFQYSKTSRKFALFLLAVLFWSIRDSLGSILQGYLDSQAFVHYVGLTSIFYLILPALSFDIFMAVRDAAVPRKISPVLVKSGRIAAFGTVLLLYVINIFYPRFMFENITFLGSTYVYTAGPGMIIYFLLFAVVNLIPSLYLICISRKDLRSEAFYFGIGGLVSEAVIIATNFFPDIAHLNYRLGCASIALFCIFCFVGIKKYGRAFSLAEILDERDKLETIGKSLKRLLDVSDEQEVYRGICEYAREISDSAAAFILFLTEENRRGWALLRTVSVQPEMDVELGFLKEEMPLELELDSIAEKLALGETVECGSLHDLFPSRFGELSATEAAKRLRIQQILLYPFTYEGNVKGAVCLFKHTRTVNTDLYSVIAVQCSLVLKYSAQIDAVEERRHLEQQLHHARKLEAVGQLAGGIAHDFNNMLAGINGYAGIIKRKYGSDNPALCRYAEVISTAVQRSSDLIKQLLVFARKGKFRTSSFSLHDTVSEVAKLLSHTIDKRIEIICRLNAENPLVCGDPSQIYNSIMNVALNARDAMPEGGCLEFETENLNDFDPGSETSEMQKGNYVVLRIEDTGIGISREDMPRIFEPFYTTKEVGKGSGLGLASVYGTLREHGGGIKVSSALGEGTKVTMYLPASGESQSDELHDTSEYVAGRGTVLVVDDEPIVREVACEILRDLGYSVLTSDNGANAADYYRENWKKIDLVLLDLVMPVMDGYDCLKELKKINPEVKVIISSGHSKKKMDFPDGVPRSISKPYEGPELSRVVAEVMRVE